MVYWIGKRFFINADSETDRSASPFQKFRKIANLILITSLFAILLTAAPFIQIPFLLFAAVITFFLFVTTSASKYAIYKKYHEADSSFFHHFKNASSDWIITFLPLLLYFGIVIPGRNLSTSIGQFSSTYHWTPLCALVVWLFHYMLLPLLWRWMYQTSPLIDPDINPELDKILKETRSHLTNIHVIQFGSDAPANAFALGLLKKFPPALFKGPPPRSKTPLFIPITSNCPGE